MAFGLTVDGLLIKTYDDLVTEVNAQLRASFGESIDLNNGIMARFVAIICEQYAELWELIQAVYSSQDPDAAVDTALEVLCAITGTVKRPATYSTVTLTLTGLAATVVNAGSRAMTTSTLKKFATLANATLAALTAWAPSTGYLVGDRCTNAGRAYVCITTGTSASSGGPTTTDADITDGTVGAVHWRYMGEGTAAADAAAQATETGPVVALSGDITTIDTPVGGWSSVINLLDAAEGADVESNEALRIRREIELGGAGTSPADAVRSELMDVTGVTAATVFVNNTDVTDADGVPPHAIEALVQGGVDQDIYNKLFASVAAGILTHGTSVGSATDSQGTSHVMKFSRPEEKAIYVVIGVTYDSRTYPASGDALIEDAITSWGDIQATGKNATTSGIASRAFQVTGVLETTYVGLSLTAIATPTTWAGLTAYVAGNVVVNAGRVYRCTSPGTSAATGGPLGTGTGIADGSVVWECLSDTIAINLRQQATYDTSRIAVFSSSATP